MADYDSRGGKYKAPAPIIEKRQPMLFLSMNDALITKFCSYVLSANPTIHRYSMVNLHKLMNSLSKDLFAEKPQIDQKVKFLLIALEGKVEQGISGDLLLYHINTKIDITPFMNDEEINKELTNEEVIYIERQISGFLDNGVFDAHLDRLKDLCIDYLAADFRKRNTVMDDVKVEVFDLVAEFRRNEAATASASTRFRLSRMNESVEEIHKYLKNPSNMLITGMKGFNEILGGGFQKTRLYCLFSLAGEGKTVSMVNLLYQVWKYNKGYKTKDPTRKPCIILLTMENLVVEYVNSLFHVITQGKSIRECDSAEEVLQEFKERKFEYMGDNDIEIVIDYKPVHSKDTRYMYEIVEELEDEGFETIAFFMDYLARIRPNEYTKDNYTDLGNASNDFKTFAILKDIPVITASQLNRDAAKLVDESRGVNKIDIVRSLGRANIGDSINIDRNLDCSIMLLPETKSDGSRYMGFQLTKARYELQSQLRVFFQPIHPSSKIAFVEDLNELDASYRTTLANTDEEIKSKLGETVVSASIPGMHSLTEMAVASTTKLLEDEPEPPPKKKFLRKVVFEIPDSVRKTKDIDSTIPTKERKALNKYLKEQNRIEEDRERKHQ